MKKITIKSFLFLSAIILLISCEDKTKYMYTRINADGSIYREFIDTGDSAFMVGDTSKSNPFLINIDSCWKITYSYGLDSLPDKFIQGWPLKKFDLKLDSIHHLRVKAYRDYSNVTELKNTFSFNNRLSNSTLWFNEIKQDFKMDKNFRWFYTYFEYTEIFKKLNPNPQTKISNFLTEEEISHYFGENSDYTKGCNGTETLNYLKNLEAKSEKWVTRCVYDACFKVIIKNYYLFSALKIDSIKFKSLQDSIFIKLVDQNSFNNDSTFFSELDKYFKTDAFSKVYAKDDSLKQELNIAEKAIETNLDCPGNLDYELTMPGKIIETNSAKKQGDTLIWKINADRFLFNDYKIYAKSRKPNYWTFAITGVILLIVTLSFRMKRK